MMHTISMGKSVTMKYLRYLRKPAMLSSAVVMCIIGNASSALAAVSISEYPVPTSFSGPNQITTGPDGNLWYTLNSSSKIGKITPSGTIMEYNISTLQTGGIVSGPDGNLWVTEPGNNRIARVTTSGVVTNFSTPTNGSNPADITIGLDGNLWFTEPGVSKIGKITTSGTITEYDVTPSGSAPQYIVTGPDGNLWFTESQNDQICMMTTAGALTCYTTPTTSAGLMGITVGPDNNLWFTENFANNIGMITPSGVITEYAFPPGSQPKGIIAANGSLWVEEWVGQSIDQVDTNGTILNSYAVSANSYPNDLVVGPDNNIWFTEFNKIGRLNLAPPVSAPAVTNGPQLPVNQTTTPPELTDTGVNVLFTSSMAILLLLASLIVRHRQTI
jgi:streptogramin lyase